MRTLLVAGLLATVAIAGCLQNDGGGLTRWDYTPPESTDAAPPAGPSPEPPTDIPEDGAPLPGVRFLLTGDTGTGSETQHQVAGAMRDVCARDGCDFMAILGDVIYEVGVSDPYDPQFEQKFELPYAELDFPVYVMVGNHDASHDPVSQNPMAPEELREAMQAGIGHWHDSGTHMVEYAKRTDRVSDKWRMPDRYYSFRYADAEFFVLDSNNMMYNGLATGSTDPEQYQLMLDQGAWFDATVAASDATWKFTLAHHPYVSNGEHGDAGDYDRYPVPVPGVRGDGVKTWFDEHVCNGAESGVVDMHLSGHDHDLQWMKPVQQCGDTEFIVSGAGAKSRELAEDPEEDAYFGRGGMQGFFWVEIVGDTLRGVVYDAEGTVLFERTVQQAA